MLYKYNPFSAPRVFRISLKIFILFVIGIHGYAQNAKTHSLKDVKSLESFLDSIFIKEMGKSKIPGAAICIVENGKTLFSKGYGYSNLETKTPVIPEKTIFRIGSITKVFTAVAVMQLFDNGLIKMKDDVNTYLQGFKVPDTFPEPVTFSDLLTHSAGFDEISKGRMVTSEAQLVPLSSFLKDRLVRIRPPGIISSYNTYGISLAGYIVEILSGLPLSQYFQKKIFAPLNMKSSNLGTLPKELSPNLATGYEYSKDAGYKPLNFVWFNTYPASDINGTVTDMAKFMIALLEGGKYGKGRILSRKVQDDMLSQHHTNHPVIPGWTYGLQESRKINGEGGLEHGGSMDDGFSSFMYLMPQHRIGIFMAGTIESTNIYDIVKESFVKQYFPVKEKSAVNPGKEDLKKKLDRFEGSYRWDPYCHSCKDSSAYYAQSVKITATNEGMLSFWGGKWIQVSPLLFQLVDGPLAGQVYVAFREDINGKITHFFLGGPWTYEKYNTTTKN